MRIIYICNTYLDNSTRGHESIAIVNDGVCALRRLFWQLKLLHAGPVQVPHLITKQRYMRIMKLRMVMTKRLRSSWLRSAWHDWIHLKSLISQLNFPVTEVEIIIFRLLVDERNLFEYCFDEWYESHLMAWIVMFTPKFVVNSDLHFTLWFLPGGSQKQASHICWAWNLHLKVISISLTRTSQSGVCEGVHTGYEVTTHSTLVTN